MNFSQTHAGHTRSTRWACVVFLSMDADYKFIWADIGGMGSASDAQMCTASELKECVEAWSRMGSPLLPPLSPRPQLHDRDHRQQEPSSSDIAFPLLVGITLVCLVSSLLRYDGKQDKPSVLIGTVI